MIRTTSLQTRLIVLVFAALFLVELATAWMGYRRALHEADELLDAQLAEYAQILLALGHSGGKSDHDDDEEEEGDEVENDDEVALPDLHAHRYQHNLLFQIWGVDGGRGDEGGAKPALILRSPDAPRQWPVGAALSGYSEAALDGRRWRIFAAAVNDERRVLAGHDLAIRDELAREIALSNMTPYLIAFPTLVLILLIVIRRALRPLNRLATELAEREPDRLDDIPEAALPSELQPPVRAMNRLFDRIRDAMAKERRFTSDAAHELRTPLAALKIQLQVAARTPDPEERLAAIAKAERGANRMNHLVAQLLALARLDAQVQGHDVQGGASAQAPDTAVITFSDLLIEVIAEQATQAEAKSIALEVAVEPLCTLQGNPDLLRALARNLIDNAIRYTPVGGTVKVSLEKRESQDCLRVADNGPGVEAALRDSLGQRFQRLGPQSAEGVGLGLSIVQRIVELHGGSLEFGEGLGAGLGLGVTVCLPGFPPAREGEI